MVCGCRRRCAAGKTGSVSSAGAVRPWPGGWGRSAARRLVRGRPPVGSRLAGGVRRVRARRVRVGCLDSCRAVGTTSPRPVGCPRRGTVLRRPPGLAGRAVAAGCCPGSGRGPPPRVRTPALARGPRAAARARAGPPLRRRLDRVRSDVACRGSGAQQHRRRLHPARPVPRLDRRRVRSRPSPRRPGNSPVGSRGVGSGRCCAASPATAGSPPSSRPRRRSQGCRRSRTGRRLYCLAPPGSPGPRGVSDRPVSVARRRTRRLGRPQPRRRKRRPRPRSSRRNRPRTPTPRSGGLACRTGPPRRCGPRGAATAAGTRRRRQPTGNPARSCRIRRRVQTRTRVRGPAAADRSRGRLNPPRRPRLPPPAHAGRNFTTVSGPKGAGTEHERQET